MNFPAFLNTISTRVYTLPMVILYVTAGCNLRCIMCSYRDPEPNELTLDEIRRLAEQLSDMGLRHIVYSGGEPLIRRDFPAICEVFAQLKVKQSLLTNGLLLYKRYSEIGSYLSEIIVSLDGPDAETHNAIRGLDAFDHIVKGIQTVASSHPRPKVSIRTVIQRKNFHKLSEMVTLAKTLAVDRISFLAADVASQAFHRAEVGSVSDPKTILLTAQEASQFETIVKAFIESHKTDIDSGFVSESEGKLFHLVRYFQACVGSTTFPRNRCNAPMVATVITSTGDLLPCYFLPAFGNIKSSSIIRALNNSRIRATREEVRLYTLQRCHECVCTLSVSPAAALFDRF